MNITEKEKRKIIDCTRKIRQYGKRWSLEVPFRKILDELPESSSDLDKFINDPKNIHITLRLFRSVNYDFERRVKSFGTKTFSYTV